MANEDLPNTPQSPETIPTGYSPLNEGYTPLQRGYSPMASSDALPTAPLGGTAEILPIAPVVADGSPQVSPE